MGEYTVAFAFIGLLAYLEWRIVPLIMADKHVNCHYCGRKLPYNEQEKIGAYVYCSEHGRKRQKSMPAAARLKANGRAMSLPPPAWVKSTKDDGPMPWES